LAVHHKNNDFWGKVIRYILLNYLQPYFLICLRELLSDGVNGFSPLWEDGIEIWKQLCDKVENKKILAERLIYDTSRCTCNLDTAKELWSILITAYKKEGKFEEVIKLIAENIELIQQTGHEEDVIEIFDNKFLNQVYKLLNPDFIIVTTLDVYVKNPELQLTENVSRVLEAIVDNTNSIRFFFTQLLVKQKLKKLTVDNDLKIKLENLPNKIEIIGKGRMEELDLQDDYKLPNWIGIN